MSEQNKALVARWFQKVWNEASPAAKQAGLLEFEVFTTTVGESPDRVIVATRLKNFAELDQPDPIQAAMSHFQGGVRQLAMYNNVEHVETYIMRYRPDISSDPRHP